MRPAETSGVGLRQPVAPLPTGNIDTDRALLALLDDRRFFRTIAGVVLTPGDDILAATRPLAEGATMLLLPGQYDVAATIVLTKRMRIVAHGALLKGALRLLTLAGDDIEIHGLQAWRTDTVVGGEAIRVEADACKLAECTIRSASTYGINVVAGADYTCVQCCKFLPDAAHIAGDSDVFFANGATFGVVCGTMWSRTAGTFALDYRALDLMSEAANGDASMINVR